jgi:hypothetical protein
MLYTQRKAGVILHLQHHVLSVAGGTEEIQLVLQHGLVCLIGACRLLLHEAALRHRVGVFALGGANQLVPVANNDHD